MKLLYLIPIFLLFSCTSIKIRETGMDSIQDLIGEIKQINVTTYRYPINSKDTIVDIGKSIVFFDSRNKIIKQIDQYPKYSQVSTFNYTNGLLESTVSKNEKNTSKVEFKYDKRKNVIEFRQFINDKLVFLKTTLYDKRNNPIEKNYYHPNLKSSNQIAKFENDYKNRTVKILSFDDNNKSKETYLKEYFDKKGFIIKTELVFLDSRKSYSGSTKNEYDKLGNLVKKTSSDMDGKNVESTTYKNTYDDKGNIIIREKYYDEKLFEKTICQITYW
jgi:hypothetical protein